MTSQQTTFVISKLKIVQSTENSLVPEPEDLTVLTIPPEVIPHEVRQQ